MAPPAAVCDRQGVDVTVKVRRTTLAKGYQPTVFWEFAEVHGRVVRPLPERAAQTLIYLDHVERTADATCRRVRIHTPHGQAWAYEHGGPLSFRPVGGGAWLQHVGGGQSPT